MRRVTALDVACPACGAEPGEACQQLSLQASSRRREPHVWRLRRAAEEQKR